MKRLCIIALPFFVLLAAAWLVTPIMLINPFKPQTPERLALGRLLNLGAPWVTLLLMLLGTVAAGLLWRRLASWWSKSLVGVAVVLLLAGVFLGRRSVFETLFHPLPQPEFAAAAEAKHVAEEDMVLGVQIAAQARAYPVRSLAYHHIVNDVIGGEPIVATY